MVCLISSCNRVYNLLLLISLVVIFILLFKRFNRLSPRVNIIHLPSFFAHKRLFLLLFLSQSSRKVNPSLGEHWQPITLTEVTACLILQTFIKLFLRLRKRGQLFWSRQRLRDVRGKTLVTLVKKTYTVDSVPHLGWIEIIRTMIFFIRLSLLKLV
jgi:hypothetical protein